MIIDLHCHSNCSDGELSPNELILLAEKNHVEILAITDHDTVDAYISLRETKIKIISGIEFSTTWNKIGIHIIGLNIDLNSNVLNQAIKLQKLARVERAKIISTRLAKIGLHDSYEKLTYKNQIGRPDFARLLVEEGICKDLPQAFKKYLGSGKLGDVKNNWLSLEQIVSTINQANGIAVLAHPLYYKLTNSKLNRLIIDFKCHGGQAIEVINGYQNPQKTDYLIKLCKDHNMLESYGSDFHRETKWNHLGCRVDNSRKTIIDFIQ